MASEWLCPYCNRKFFSIDEKRDEEYVSCANCGEKVENPYFQGNRGERDERYYKQLNS